MAAKSGKNTGCKPDHLFTALSRIEESSQIPDTSLPFSAHGDNEEGSGLSCTHPIPSPGRRLPESPPDSTYLSKDSPTLETQTPQSESYSYQLLGGLPSYTSSEWPLNIFPPVVDDDGDLTYGPDPRNRNRKIQWGILGCASDVCVALSESQKQRSQLRQKRAELREIRDEVAEQGAELITQMNILLDGLDCKSTDVAGFKRLCAEYKDIRDRYQKLEDDYNNAEYDSREDESLLWGSHWRLEKAMKEYPTHVLKAAFEDTADDAENTASASDETQRYPPLVSKYLACLWEIDELSGDLSELRAEREALLEEQAMRQRYGLSLGADGLKELEEFPEIEAEILAKLEQAEMDAEQLKTECDMQSLSTNPNDYGTRNEIERRDLEVSLTSFAAIDPLYHWRRESPAFFEQAITIEKSVNIIEFINKWLIGQLFHSSFEIFRFRSSPESGPLNVDMDELRGLILDHWDKSATLYGTPLLPDEDDSTRRGHVSDEGSTYSSINSFSDDVVLQPAGNSHQTPSPANVIPVSEGNDAQRDQACDDGQQSPLHDDIPESVRVPDNVRTGNAGLSMPNEENQKVPSTQVSVDISPSARVTPGQKNNSLLTEASSDMQSQISMNPSNQKGRALPILDSNRIVKGTSPNRFEPLELRGEKRRASDFSISSAMGRVWKAASSPFKLLTARQVKKVASWPKVSTTPQAQNADY